MDLSSITPAFGDTANAVGKWVRDTASIGATASVTYALVNAVIQKWRERPLVVHHAYISERKSPDGSKILHLQVQIFNRMAQPVLFQGLHIVGSPEARFLQVNKLTPAGGGRFFVRPEFVRDEGLRVARRQVIAPFVPGASHFPSAEITAEIGPAVEDQPLKVRAILSAMPHSRLIRSKTIAVAVVMSQ